MSLHGLSDRFLAAIASTHTLARQVLVQAPNGDVTDITQWCLAGGSVSVDETRKIRRTCMLPISGEPDLVPEDAADLLHPASGNELVVKRGVKYPDGTTEMAQLGVFRLTKPVFNDNGALIASTINGQDRMGVVSRIDWLSPYVIAAGSNITTALSAAMDSRYPGLDYSGFDDITFSFPNTTFGADPSQPGDPAQDFINFAGDAAAEIFFDPLGNPILRLITNPLTSVIVDSTTYVEGVGWLSNAGRTLDETTAFNGVVLYCNGFGVTPPFVVEVWDTDPSSPSYYLGKWGKVPKKITTTTIPSGADDFSTANGKALASAYGQLQLVLGSFDDVAATSTVNGALREGDGVAAQRNRLGINGGYVISNMNIPLDGPASMVTGFRPRVQAK